MSLLKKYVFHSPVHYGIALGINVFFTLLVLFINGFDYLIYYVNALGVAGGVSFFFGVLLWLSSAGAFTTFGYAFSYFRAERKYKDLYEYTQAKEKKVARQNKIQIPYILVGLVFLMASLILSKVITTI